MTVRDGMRRSVRAAWAFPIILYQKIVSPWIPKRCIYHPTCSAYAREAIHRHGVLSGTVFGLGRIFRCTGLFFNPGYDPVPENPSIEKLVDGYRTFRKRK